MESELVELQVKITYLEKLVTALDEVVTSHADGLSALTERLAQVEAQLVASDKSEPGVEPPPPHY